MSRKANLKMWVTIFVLMLNDSRMNWFSWHGLRHTNQHNVFELGGGDWIKFDTWWRCGTSD
jgi:hypothetical protein